MFVLIDGGDEVRFDALQQMADFKKDVLRSQNAERIYASGATLHKQINALAGRLSSDEVTVIDQAVADCRAECDALEAQIDNILADDSLSEAEKAAAIQEVEFV